MPKEKSYNPVQAQRKADKARAIKKGKAEVQERRNERLARKNPDRIQTQIDDLKAIASKGGKLTSREEHVLGGLEKELKAVRKAREALGDSAPSLGRPRDRESRPAVLGKRRRGSQDASSSDDDVPDDVRDIPMPRDTPPPISKDVLDRWYAKRRARRSTGPGAREGRGDDGPGDGGGPEQGERRPGQGESGPGRGATAAPTEHKTVYEARPVMRDLRKEAVSAFVPAAVQMKMARSQGRGRLLEPDEADSLEREGYLGQATAQPGHGARAATAEDAADDDDDDDET